ncbi:hypothetical protein DSL92_04865 [Billgrantia gudaonensis]|uniref:Uncharacterized protein n=1 Tax=Billgrantia gudaonensis TaxID=376427 RepID=A0A3S0NX25_9GAMM|nr:hypothetical protein DSL92_04865 [Halomonas gudaonensis]
MVDYVPSLLTLGERHGWRLRSGAVSGGQRGRGHACWHGSRSASSSACDPPRVRSVEGPAGFHDLEALIDGCDALPA